MRRRVDNETLATTMSGALLGGLAGSIWGTPRVGATVGAVHGWFAGRHQVYERNRRGVIAFVLDHTWALATTIAGTVVLLVSSVGGGAGFEESLSRRHNRFVHRRGFVLRRGFALTVGTVVTGAGGVDGEITDRRLRLVERHEDVHVWQARLLGPMYPVLYALWFAGGSLFALARRFTSPSSTRLGDDVDRYAYYRNPFEWHAYTCDDNWPPASSDPTGVWSSAFPLDQWIPRSLRESTKNQEVRR